jgi:thymidylate kinase
MQRKGKFIMVDGLTGSGKSTILKAVHEWAASCHHRMFKLHDWKDPTPPRFEDLPEADVYFTYEPTRSWIGAAIRYELSQTENPYGGEELAHAFALDRQIMYRRLILPALAAGKHVIQDRGVSSSIVYQPVMPNSVPLETLLELPGNKLALEHAPDALVLTTLPATLAHERIQSRSDESKGVFAELDFMKLQEERFAADWFRNLFTQRGSTIYEVDTSQTLKESKDQATTLINQLLNAC